MVKEKENVGAWSMNIMIYQPSFNLATALHNLHRLSDNFIAVFRKMYRAMPDENTWLTPQSDYRCHMLAHHLLFWHLYAIFEPSGIRVDIFELLRRTVIF